MSDFVCDYHEELQLIIEKIMIFWSQITSHIYFLLEMKKNK